MGDGWRGRAWKRAGVSRCSSSVSGMPNRTPIDKLFDALKKGDEAALQDLLPPLRERISLVAKRRIRGVRSEELTQETLSTLWEKRDSIRTPDHLLPFVFQTLRFKIGDVLMEIQREQRRQAAEADLHDLPADPPTAHPERLTEARALDLIFDRAIATCIAENRVWGRVLQLLRQGCSREDIRRELGNVPMATVYTRIHRARKRLKEILEEDFGIRP
jgi:DNA-directed RNA polymerase specialized sigma24 family protein